MSQQCLARIGARIRQAREAKGLTLHEVAHQTAWTVHGFEALEAGDRLMLGTMSLARVYKLAAILGVSVGWILGETHEQISGRGDTTLQRDEE